MIRSVSNQESIQSVRHFPRRDVASPLRQISSIQSLRPMRLFSILFDFLKWLFCCCPKESIAIDDAPEIDPRSLSKTDPFVKELFVFDGSGCYSYRSKAKEKVVELFSALGSGSYWSWIPKAFSLTKVETEIVDLKPHPLAFLYFVLSNKLHTSHLAHFKNEALRGRWLLRIKTGRDPWEEFLTRQATNFSNKTDIMQKLPGFCKALGLDEKQTTSLAHGKKWRELIIFVYEARKKHFKL
ncbi:MAG: hypothetical protein P0S96_04650 [Simkaniaceae bacterium]|nr:hypothetical protein [Candidatus Sacchlamyda saccharinae]